MKILIPHGTTPSGYGIAQVEDRLVPLTDCCGALITITSNFYQCGSCMTLFGSIHKGMRGNKRWNKGVLLDNDSRFGNVAQNIEQWTGLKNVKVSVQDA